MKELNTTPVRTSENYGINDIKIDFQIPKKIRDFNNMQISGDVEDFEILNNASNKALKYGCGKELENAVFNKSNKDLKIETNKKGKICLEFEIDENNVNLVENIEFITNAKNTIIIKYLSNGENPGYHNGIIRVHAKPNSETNIIVINLLNKNTNSFLSIENTLEEQSTVNYIIVDFGGKNSVTNYYSNIVGDNAKANLNTIYLGTNEQVFDINYIAELFGKGSQVNIDVQGALKDESKKNFKGTIDFKKGSKKAKGNENEFCMLLSDKAKSKALPMLLCTEEDVEGNHASSAGKIDKDILFYIQSRGLSEKDAMKLIVKAKFNETIQKIRDEKLQKEILGQIDERLN